MARMHRSRNYQRGWNIQHSRNYQYGSNASAAGTHCMVGMHNVGVTPRQGRKHCAAGTTSLAGTHSVTVTPAGRERAARQ
ncbi:hypothetical protein KQI74_11025 [Paenibacillus barcinonensis]|uniref:hypothetical protein n=1 Tax=Paenibacillus barcinonensis TaxID=198119 RepID=UPI001C114154|nr:hypothetical protein [Paenibacillus barcinonensis]MBU5352819.1 hypothetical protein [Paenibacillus barcinonensis]